MTLIATLIAACLAAIAGATPTTAPAAAAQPAPAPAGRCLICPVDPGPSRTAAPSLPPRPSPSHSVGIEPWRGDAPPATR